MIGAIVGAAASIGSAIAGGVASKKAKQKNQAILGQMRRDSQNWYDKEYNADFTQRADAQSALNRAREILTQKYKNAQGAAEVSGATDESVAMQKASANETLANITGSIAERADAYKEQVRNNYENQKTALNQAEMNINSGQAAGIAQAAGGLATAGSMFAGLDDDLFKGKKASPSGAGGCFPGTGGKIGG